MKLLTTTEVRPYKILLWVDDLLTSPRSVGLRAKKALSDDSVSNISEQEYEILEQIVEIARKEQEEKDQLLVSVLQQWLSDNPKGKAVIFCTQEEVAQYLGRKLQNHFAGGVYLNSDLDIDLFNLPENKVRVLLCDQRGEDGLNLHGGSRLAVHYSLPRDFSRIEQRLGRFNRYSANLKGVKPLQSLVLLPGRTGITDHWVGLLDDVMHAFNRTLASLQYMLEKQLDLIWQDYTQEGYIAFNRAEKRLDGEDGLIAKEFKRVKAQEGLMSMEEEVEEAFEFAEGLEEADEIAEEQIQRMTGWITDALQFRQKGHPGEGFRFQFHLAHNSGARTLVDVPSFISTCLLGLDFNGGYPPVTMLMSASRTEVSDGRGLYPFRFGQPFVDTIWDLTQTDTRGTSMAFLRVVPNGNYSEPEIFFRFSWLVSADNCGANRIERRIADDIFPPVVESFWLRQDGQPIDTDTTELVNSPYKRQSNTDLNLRDSIWYKLEEWFPQDQWRRLVIAVTEKALSHCLDLFMDTKIEVQPRLLSIKAVVLCDINLLSYIESI